MSNEVATAPAPEANGKPAKAGKKAKAVAPKKAAVKKPAAVKPAKAVKGGSPLAFLKLAAPTLSDVALKHLIFDRRLQHRKGMTDADTVAAYAEVDAAALADRKPTPFPPVRAIHQTVDEEGKPCDLYWVYDGFQRGGAFQTSGRKTVPVEVTEGTFEDAFFLSLSSNSTNSILPRNKDDARRSVFALLDAPDTLEVVAKKSKQYGGFMRAIGAAVGVSVGTVDNALKDRGLMVKGDKLTKRPAPRLKPDTEPEGDAGASGDSEGGAAAGAQGETPPSPEAVKAANDAKYRELMTLGFTDRVNEALRLSKRIANIVSTLHTDTTFKTQVRAAMKKHGMSVSDEFDARATAQGKDFTPYYEILELWPVATKLGNFFADLKKIGEAAKEENKGTEVPQQS